MSGKLLSGYITDNEHPVKILQGRPIGWVWCKSGAFDVCRKYVLNVFANRPTVYFNRLCRGRKSVLNVFVNCLTVHFMQFHVMIQKAHLLIKPCRVLVPPLCHLCDRYRKLLLSRMRKPSYEHELRNG